MEFIDTHAHIYRKQFNFDRAAVVKRAIETGVTKIFQANLNLESVEPMLKLCNTFPDNCFPMLGIHPKHIRKNFNEEIEKIKELLQKHKFYAIGEVGLDFYWAKHIKKEIGYDIIPYQIEAFTKFIQLASKYNLPMNLHIRNATDIATKILQKERKSNTRGVWHAFNNNIKINKFKNWGFKVGIGGMLTFKNYVAETVKKYELENFVLETDAPFLTPQPIKKINNRNESKNIVAIAEYIAKLKNITLEKVAYETTKNAKQIYF